MQTYIKKVLFIILFLSFSVFNFNLVQAWVYSSNIDLKESLEVNLEEKKIDLEKISNASIYIKKIDILVDKIEKKSNLTKIRKYIESLENLEKGLDPNNNKLLNKRLILAYLIAKFEISEYKLSMEDSSSIVISKDPEKVKVDNEIIKLQMLLYNNELSDYMFDTYYSFFEESKNYKKQWNLNFSFGFNKLDLSNQIFFSNLKEIKDLKYNLQLSDYNMYFTNKDFRFNSTIISDIVYRYDKLDTLYKLDFNTYFDLIFWEDVYFYLFKNLKINENILVDIIQKDFLKNAINFFNVLWEQNKYIKNSYNYYNNNASLKLIPRPKLENFFKKNIFTMDKKDGNKYILSLNEEICKENNYLDCDRLRQILSNWELSLILWDKNELVYIYEDEHENKINLNMKYDSLWIYDFSFKFFTDEYSNLDIDISIKDGIIKNILLMKDTNLKLLLNWNYENDYIKFNTNFSNDYIKFDIDTLFDNKADFSIFEVKWTVDIIDFKTKFNFNLKDIYKLSKENYFERKKIDNFINSEELKDSIEKTSKLQKLK